MTQNAAQKLTSAVSGLMHRFADAAHHARAGAKGVAGVARRRPLSLLAPLMAGTVLSSTALPERPPIEQASWSHGTLSVQDVRLTGHTAAAQDNVLPARCYSPKADEKNPLFNTDPTNWRGFYVMSRGGAFTRGLHGVARNLDLSVCIVPDSEQARSYDVASRIAGISDEAPLSTNIREAAHAIIHAQMERRDLSAPAADEALFSRINRHLTGEAVAVVAEYVVAAEQHAGGAEGMLDELRTQNPPGFAVFLASYGEEISAGRSPSDAIARAASTAINFLLRQPEFITANSTDILTRYVHELGQPGARPRSRSDFSTHDARRMGQAGRASIAGGVQLLTLQQLGAISPQTAQLVEAMQSMHAARNGYTAPRTYQTRNPYTTVSHTALAEQMSNSGGIYNARQAFERARHAATYVYRDRRWQMSASFQHGMQADYTLEQTPEVSRPLWQHLDTMRRLSPTFGPGMADIAAERNVILCYGTPEVLQPNTVIHGVWHHDSGIIQMGRHHHGRATSSTQILAHELLHMMQTHSQINLFNRDWTIRDIQSSVLSREASASVISILVAMEYKLNGDNSLWTLGADQAAAERMWAIYADARHAGTSHNDSLLAAGAAGYQMMFERQWWLDIYNTSSARWVITNLSANWFQAPGTRGFTLDMAQLSGKVTDSFNFTAGLTALPDDRQRFGSNADMGHLFGYLQLQQLVQRRGQNHAETRALRQRLTDSGNPYLDVDFAQLSAAVMGDTSRSVIEQINCLAGRGACAAATAEPRRPTPPAERRPHCAA